MEVKMEGSPPKCRLQRFLKRLECDLKKDPQMLHELHQSLPSKVHVWVDDETSTGNTIDTVESAISSSSSKISENHDTVTGSCDEPKKKSRRSLKPPPETSKRPNPTDGITTTSSGTASIPIRNICRSFFFTGRCDHYRPPELGGSHRQLRSSCQYIHGGASYVHNNKDTMCDTTNFIQIEPKYTLWNVLRLWQQPHEGVSNIIDNNNNNSTTTQRTTLELDLCIELQQSCHSNEQQWLLRQNGVTSSSVSPSNTMNLLYHMEVDMERHNNNDDEDANEDPIATFLHRLRSHDALSHHPRAPRATIAYMAFDNVLVYDRYRQRDNGLLDLSDHNKGTIVELLRTIYFGHGNEYRDLTATNLNHILQFLPDTAIASMERVCRHWYNQIRTSPMIWISMLNRHGWYSAIHVTQEPQDHDQVLMSDVDRVMTFRETFGQHYMILRDMTALQSGFNQICRPDQNEPGVGSFNTEYWTFHADVCDVKEWSDSCILAVLDDDCFYFIEAPSGDSSASAGKSPGAHGISIVDSLRGHGYALIRLNYDLDDEHIYVMIYEDCMFRHPRYQIASFKRGDTLFNTKFKGTLNVRDAIVAYIYLKVFDPSDPVRAFLNDDGDEDDLLIKHTSATIIPCGNGQFLYDVVLTTKEMKLNTHHHSGDFLSWKLCLFSEVAKGTVWSLELSRISPLWSFNSIVVSSVRRSSTDSETQPTCDFIIWNPYSGAALLGQVYMNGTVIWNYTIIPVPIPSTDWTFDNIECDITDYPLGQEWESYKNEIYLVSTITDVIITYPKERQTVICFYRKNADGTIADTCQEISMSEGLMIMLQPSVLRTNCVAFVCRRCDDGVLVNIVIHVPSRMEICLIVMDQIPVWDADDLYEHIPRIASNCHDTVSLCSNSLGIVMTGYNIRKTLASPPEIKKKKASLKRSAQTKNTKNKKKDGSRVM